MTDEVPAARSAAWRAHGITLAVLTPVIGVLAYLLAVSDNPHDFLELGGVLALFLCIAFCAYAILATLLVLAFAHRPLDVVGMHLSALGLLGVLGLAVCGRG